MSGINMSSILSKARGRVGASVSKKVSSSANGDAVLEKIRVASSEENMEKIVLAGEELRRFIVDSAYASLPGGVAGIANGLSCGTPYENADGSVSIDLTFEDDNGLARESMSVNYEGIDNVLSLYSKGVDHIMKPVYGYWHGERHRSRTIIPGVPFVPNGVEAFMGSCADKYNVISVEVSSEYYK